MKKIISIFIFFVFFSAFAFAQTSSFNLNEYKNFLNSHQNMSKQELLSIYDAGKFEKSVKNFPSNILYLDSIELKLQLTDYEKKLLNQNEFFVTERVSNDDVIQMLQRIYHLDLPLFISTDIILKAFHQSYDGILKGVEISFLIPKLEQLLSGLQDNLSILNQKYSFDSRLIKMLRDVDVYICVARKLLTSNAQPFYSDNLSNIDHILNNIESLRLIEEPLFSETARKVDYSQFKPRGHYTDTNFPQLERYFKTMIWLGRTELYLIKPVSDDISPTDQDIQRQVIDSYLISEAVKTLTVKPIFDEMEKVIASFVGEQDNVTLDQFNSISNAVNISSAKDLLSMETVKRFQDTLSTKPFAGQKILSQVLSSNPMNVSQIKPASAFLLFGQRFVIDSYITGNVVFDRTKSKRMLPSTLDILFALGNSAAAQLLTSEIDKFQYAANLSALRYLIDSYDSNFWNSAIYNLWLNSIRSLNPPAQRETLPPFMQTGAWWQQKMNTQLASWAELRHDNLLYAKQSYSGIPVCSFPFSYVEPIPAFYKSMKELANQTIEKFNNLSIDLDQQKIYFNGFALVMDTLETIAQKELDKIQLTDKENKFLRGILYESPGCVPVINGWYSNKLIYQSWASSRVDHVVADFHTSPADEFGNMVGWIKHAGTGPVNLSVVVTNLSGVGDVAFTGPVSSYYEYTTTNFLRLTDEEWHKTYLKQSLRPDWVNIYLADENGESKGAGTRLITNVSEEKEIHSSIPTENIILQNFPNPFNSETIIHFTIPSQLSNSLTELLIYNVTGEVVKRLLKKEIPAGNYLVRWDGTNEFNNSVSSGVYFYNLKVGSRQVTGKMNLLK
jgi:hypothetical protein